MLGISIKPTIGIGDALQYSSVPENYFRETGEKLVDVSRPWFFDHNPFVSRDPRAVPETVHEMWNFGPTLRQWIVPRPDPAPRVYLSNAEVGATVFGVPVRLNRPRLYRFENRPFDLRRRILLQTQGRSHGQMPGHVIEHVIEKYGPTGLLFHIGPGPDIGLPRVTTEILWDLAEEISTARMVIGLDSGPAWIAACYPDVIVKKLRTKPSVEHFKTWTPLEIGNIHSHWDDRCHQIFNVSEEDVGFTSTYRNI